MPSTPGTSDFYEACVEEESNLGVNSISLSTRPRTSTETGDGEGSFRDSISPGGTTLSGTIRPASSETETIDKDRKHYNEDPADYFQACSQEERSLGALPVKHSKSESMTPSTYVSVFHDRLSRFRAFPGPSSRSFQNSAIPTQEIIYRIGSHLGSFGTAAGQYAQSSVESITTIAMSALGLGDKWTKIEESSPGLIH
jgi:hypothetical protein